MSKPPTLYAAARALIERIHAVSMPPGADEEVRALQAALDLGAQERAVAEIPYMPALHALACALRADYQATERASTLILIPHDYREGIGVYVSGEPASVIEITSSNVRTLAAAACDARLANINQRDSVKRSAVKPAPGER